MSVTTEGIAEADNGTVQINISRQRKPAGFQRLFTISSVVMTAVLPIGIYPRIVQVHELAKNQLKAETQLPIVSSTRPKQEAALKYVTLPGSLEADTEAQLYARANGFVKNRYVDIGDKVVAGQLLAEIETPEIDDSVHETKALVLTYKASKTSTEADLQQSQADLEKASADLDQAKAIVAQRQHDQTFASVTKSRWTALALEGAVSRQDADDKSNTFNVNSEATDAARGRVRAAEAEIAAVKAHLNAVKAKLQVDDANIQAAQARQQRANTEKSFQDVVAPFAGVITVRNVDPGALVSSGSDSAKLPMFKLEKIDSLRVFVDVPQYFSNRIRKGQSVDISFKELPDKVFSGKVLRTSFSLDSTARTLRTEVQIPNKDLTLAPGMYGEVKFSVANTNRGFLVPASALVQRSDGPQLITIEDEKIRYRKVRLGDDLGKEIEVIGGLTGKESLVDNPSDTLRDGMRVSVR